MIRNPFFKKIECAGAGEAATSYGGIIRVNQKFRGIVLALFLASAAASAIVYFSSYFTPALIGMFQGDGTLAVMVTVAALIFLRIMELLGKVMRKKEG